MSKPYIIAEVLMDADGNYYINVPQAEQGGIMGYGPMQSSDSTNLHATCELLEGQLRRWHAEIMSKIQYKESGE